MQLASLCAVAGSQPCVLFAVLRVRQHLLLLRCSTFSVGQLPALHWPCRVWWAQLAAAPFGAAAKAWHPSVPVVYDRLGDSWCEVSIEWSAGAGRLDFLPLFFAQYQAQFSALLLSDDDCLGPRLSVADRRAFQPLTISRTSCLRVACDVSPCFNLGV